MKNSVNHILTYLSRCSISAEGSVIKGFIPMDDGGCHVTGILMGMQIDISLDSKLSSLNR